MSKFKIGDKVTLNADSRWASGNPKNPIGVVGTVYGVNRGGDLDVHVQWPDGSNGYASADLTLADTTDQRQALSDAIYLLAKHRVIVTGGQASGDSPPWFKYGTLGCGHGSRDALLDRLLPPAKTADQLEIEEVEGKLRVLADQLAKLKER